LGKEFKAREPWSDEQTLLTYVSNIIGAAKSSYLDGFQNSIKPETAMATQEGPFKILLCYYQFSSNAMNATLTTSEVCLIIPYYTRVQK
jgi:hypothetical protein